MGSLASGRVAVESPPPPNHLYWFYYNKLVSGNGGKGQITVTWNGSWPEEDSQFHSNFFHRTLDSNSHSDTGSPLTLWGHSAGLVKTNLLIWPPRQADYHQPGENNTGAANNITRLTDWNSTCEPSSRPLLPVSAFFSLRIKYYNVVGAIKQSLSEGVSQVEDPHCRDSSRSQTLYLN